LLKKNPLYQKATETILSTIITTALSIGLISGGSYLLFGYQSELEQIENVNSEFEIIHEQYNSYSKMMDVFATEPFTTEQINTEIVTIGILKANKSDSKLSGEFVQFTTDWCNNLLLELATIKGSIDGFAFQQENVYGFDETQTILLSKIQADISVVQQIKSLVAEWESLDISEKDSRLTEIEKMVIVQAEKLQSGMSHLQQRINSSEIRLSALNKLKTDSDRAYNRFQIKFAISIIGIFAGILLLAIIMYAVFFDSKDKTKSGSKVEVKKEAKPKGKGNAKKRG
jgi:hypothetical protein